MPITPSAGQPVQSDWIREPGVNQLFEKGGKRYAIATEYRQHGLGWQLLQGTKALALTIITWGFGFLSENLNLKSKWEEAWTGKEKHYVVDRWPPATAATTTEKVKIIAVALLFPLDEEQLQKLKTLIFIDSFRSKTIYPWELYDKLTQALSIETLITDPEDRQTLLEMGETIASDYAKYGKFNEAKKWREETAAKLGIKISPEKMQTLELLDKLRINPSSVSAIDLILQFPTALKAANAIKSPEDRQLLLDAAEKIALFHVANKQFSDAKEVRIDAAKAFSDSPAIGEIHLKSFFEQYNADKFGYQDASGQITGGPAAYLDLSDKLRDVLDHVSKQTALVMKDKLQLLAETFAIELEKSKKFDEATGLRIKAAQALLPLIPVDAFKAKEMIARLKFAPESLSIEDAISKVGGQIPQELKNQLLQFSEASAAELEKGKQFDKATALRIKAAQALLPSVPSDEIKAKEAEARLKYAPESLSLDQIKLAMNKFASKPKMADRTAVFSLAETVAARYLQENNPKMAIATWVEAQRIYFAEPKTAAIHDDVLFAWEIFKKGLEMGQKSGDPEIKTALLFAAELIASEAIKLGDLQSATAIRMEVAKKISPAPPLGDLKALLAKEDPKLGLKIYPVDTTLFKNHTLSIQRRTFGPGDTRLHLEARLGHPARDKLQKSLDLIKAKPQVLHGELPPGFCTGITIEQRETCYLGRAEKNGKPFAGDFSHDAKNGYIVQAKYNKTYVPAQETVIRFAGVGSIKIGSATPELYRSLYNRITIDLEPHITEEEAVAKVMIMLSALGLEAAASSPRPEDEEKIKIMQLFHILYPREAYAIERDEKLVNGSLEALKRAIETIVPNMKVKFKTYLQDHPDLMYKQEVYPGQSVWAIKGIAEEVKKEGALGLMAGIGGATFEGAVGSFASMLKHGALSSDDRFEKGIIVAGGSSGEDLRTGGGEYVFSRLIMDNMEKNPGHYVLNGQFQILYDLDLIERAGLIYDADKFGTKEQSTYTGSERKAAVELAKAIKANPYKDYKGNEVCLGKRVPPQYMKGVLVASNYQKTTMIQLLKADGLVILNTSGVECINGIPIDQFIHVGEFKKEYWP